MSRLQCLRVMLLMPGLLLSVCLQADNSVAEQQALAPGYGSLQFTAPEPGTYELPELGPAADGSVLNSEGQSMSVHSLLGDKIVVLSFIYATCSDVNGCPLATAVLHKISKRLQQEPALSKHLRLLTLSFNPMQDTPAVMKQFGAAFQESGVDWRFLTTESDQQLQPLISRYQQNLSKVFDDQGRDTGTFTHHLRVYLIDQHKQIRNIYNVAFLHPDTLISDIKTLLQNNAKAPRKASTLPSEAVFAAGDNKSNYADKQYQTHSIAITERSGAAADLLQTLRKPPLGLPTVPVPADNAITKDKINLGRKLFYDRRLSFNNTFSCAMCHIPEQGFTNNEMATAVGIEGRTVRRNTPTLYNVAYASRLFHDGRETSLEQQVWGPLLAHNEMANPAIAGVIEKIKHSAEYPALFQQAFAKQPTMESIGMALASYQRTLNSANSAFDRWYYGAEQQALNTQQQRGFALFTGKANCAACHIVGKDFALFTDNDFHNTGIGYAEAMHKPAEKQRIQIAPGVYVDAAASLINTVSEVKPNDLGRYEITQNPLDRWKYKTPTLRNISLTAPYMHNGRFSTLQQVVEFYNAGGVGNENLDPLLKPLQLTKAEMDDLSAFLLSLTGDNIKELVSDAFAAPIGDSQ
ncbi:MAG: cytochrome c peroxidase [Methylococcales bacterium]